MKWMKAVFLSSRVETSFSLEEKTDDHEAVYRATQFSGSCTWKSLHQHFVNFYQMIGKKAYLLLKFLRYLD